MKKKIRISLLAILSFLAVGCTESIDNSARYVFKESTVDTYLQKHEQYSEYYKLLKMIPVSQMTKTSVQQLMTARGNYTVFAPTNEAIQLYLDSLVADEIIPRASWDAFTDSVVLDSIRKVIVYNSIIDSGDDYRAFETSDFPTQEGSEIAMANMYDRKLNVSYPENSDTIYISGSALDPINCNIPALNGVIHCMHQVVAPSNNSLRRLYTRILERNIEGFHVAAMLSKAVGLLDTLDLIVDHEYETAYLTGKIPLTKTGPEYTCYSPQHRYYGFTLFAETDEFWAKELGKPALEITVQDVYDYLVEKNIYPEATRDANYTSTDNLLNQFVTYHYLPEKLTTDHLMYHYNEYGYTPNPRTLGCAMDQFLTTMGKRRLLKLYESKESNGIYLNRFPKLRNGRHGNYHEESCDPDKEGILIGESNMTGLYDVRNGIIYPINGLLTYSDEVRDNMQKQRIRWEVTAMWPEFMNNDIRMSTITDNRHKYVMIPTDNEYKYLPNVWMSEDTWFFYWTGYQTGWSNAQGDEMSIEGMTDCTMELPPVPRAGTYELRFAIQCGGDKRGMVQCYWGSNRENLAPTGIPMDLRQGTKFRNTAAGQIPSDTGYEADTDDDDYNAEVEKKMRNKDFMKGCVQYCAGNAGAGSMRNSDICIRRILLREPMDPDKTYYIRFKTVMDDPTRYLYMDYLEYCPKEVYDNPAEPEDIW